ncbi:MAG: aspartyl/asparaginyl beta-hydroxylase domain-containing protein, partial [Burkholderiaceae bacterium]
MRHRDPFASSLHYHLGWVTPNDDGCFIVVDGGSYFWRDGEAVMFDETYIHDAENTTNPSRNFFLRYRAAAQEPLAKRAQARFLEYGDAGGEFTKCRRRTGRCHQPFFLPRLWRAPGPSGSKRAAAWSI